MLKMPQMCCWSWSPKATLEKRDRDSLAAPVISPTDIFGILIFASLFLAFVLGWNNSGLTTGNLANLIEYRFALSITLAGMLVGFLIEGSKMTHSVIGGLVAGPLTNQELASALIVSLLLFLALTVLEIPVSLSNCVVGAFCGVSISGSTTISSGFLVVIIGSWLIAPFLCMGVAVAIYEIVATSVRSVSLPTTSWANRILLIIAVFYVSYSLGANNGGMIVSFIANSASMSSFVLSVIGISIYAAIAAGTILFGKTIARVVGNKIVQLNELKTVSALLSAAFVTWIFTQISIPLSFTQVVIGGMLGAGIARGPTIVNRSELFSMIWHWIAVTILSSSLSYGLEYLVRSIA